MFQEKISQMVKFDILGNCTETFIDFELYYICGGICAKFGSIWLFVLKNIPPFDLIFSVNIYTYI